MAIDSPLRIASSRRRGEKRIFPERTGREITKKQGARIPEPTPSHESVVFLPDGWSKKCTHTRLAEGSSREPPSYLLPLALPCVPCCARNCTDESNNHCGLHSRRGGPALLRQVCPDQNRATSDVLTTKTDVRQVTSHPDVFRKLYNSAGRVAQICRIQIELGAVG